MFFSGQGKVFAAQRDAEGNPGAMKFLGNVPTLSIQLETGSEDKRESTSGQRLLAHRLFTTKDANLSITLDEFTADNLALGLYGSPATLPGGEVLEEELPDDLVPGDYVRLEGTSITNLEIVDSEGTPATLTEGTHYRIESASHGTIEILDVDGLTQPFLADYDDGGGVNVAMFTQPPPVRFFRFEGLNTADDNRPVLVELYQVQLSPLQELGLINEAYGELVLTGAALFDPVREQDPVLGPFGRMILL